jgi:cobalt-zinc-cadmium resistance protein CzcA
MVSKIIQFSVKHKLIVFLFVAGIVFSGIYSLMHIPLGAVPDITNNQVQVITTTRDLSTEDVEQFITYPVELEMGNLPGITEIRSVSKFGLSVVTLVFEDRMGTYLPRQLIAEKLQSLAGKMPEGVDAPQMGPISTGLGEIYQYTLEVEPAYKDKYSLMELRTIQDWIVKRNLTGIPGVVEVNTWGGKLKQFEVAMNPERLKAMNVSVLEVYEALKNNNAMAGGGYIEKNAKSYFIRSDGLVRNIEDIRNIVVKRNGEMPVYIKDIGRVRYGYATRFGAVTGNGEGEKVMGQVMMLKDANVSEVIKNVKERVAEISKSLPEGVYINPFLERTELLNKTTFTIAENLILGSIIVMFVVWLLLGNWRSALVISSVIPLSLLFALTLMYIFGIDANLMSLGAIDFGIIIDGAVIIVEFIALQVAIGSSGLSGKNKKDLQAEMDKISIESSRKMMHSAIFGQLIIIIVFVPILALTGVEGKMFKPMALVFIFALLGVMLLGMTYLPAVSAVLLKPVEEKNGLSKRIIGRLNAWFEPVLRFALKHKKSVVAGAAGIFLLSLYIFGKLGGEFVPTLDEGDFVIQPVLKTGTSLEKTIETTTKIEKILLEFPEVEQVVSRIGAAEVPTDPMSMEDSDIIIKLKPKSEWKTAKTKDELADKFKEALSVLPGIEYEFTQPIEMRFNELISGTRSDVSVKIYGEDLDVLNRLARQIKAKIDKIPGAADVVVEKTAGLPQMKITIKRKNLAKYGLSVEQVNKIVSIALSGLPAGEVFEGEKRFDLVARFDRNKRSNLDDLKNIPLISEDGRQIPLSEVAEIGYAEGPAKISRDATRRRIGIGINVRDRDLESVVNDIKEVIDTEIKLPAGYTVKYGGQFENLQSAKKRLLIVVPVALVLIFVLLYFAFGTVRLSMLIYSAIPLSVIGGIWALWLRGMPFSISAGIGFIALFGVSVLNGIVLIEHFKELKNKFDDINEMVIQGAKDRMRPVLLTALSAMGGFLPMAVSQSAGAEVQRPLATVVIGGLFSATLLTLVVLPVLYTWFENVRIGPVKIRKVKNKTLLLFLFLMPVVPAYPQESGGPDYDGLVREALKNNLELKQYRLQVRQAQTGKRTAFDPGKTDISFDYDPTNPDPGTGLTYRTFTVSQEFEFPSYYAAERKRLDRLAQAEEKGLEWKELQIRQEVGIVYQEILFLENTLRNYSRIFRLYEKFLHAAERKFELGESNRLEVLTARAKLKEIEMKLLREQSELKGAYARLSLLLNRPADMPVKVKIVEPVPLEPEKTFPENHPLVQRSGQLAEAAFYEWKAGKRKNLPGWYVSYSYGNSFRPSSVPYNAFGVGIKIPLFSPVAAKNKIKRWEWEKLKLADESMRKKIQTARIRRIERLETYRFQIDYYQKEGKQLAEHLLRTAELSFKNGEIDFFKYVQTVENAMQIHNAYLENLFHYNVNVLKINYLTDLEF